MQQLQTALEQNDTEFLIGFLMFFEKTPFENYTSRMAELLEKDITKEYEKAMNFAIGIKTLHGKKNNAL